MSRRFSNATEREDGGVRAVPTGAWQALEEWVASEHMSHDAVDDINARIFAIREAARRREAREAAESDYAEALLQLQPKDAGM
jgi:hypothetical protein